jgi:hypothetical protein
LAHDGDPHVVHHGRAGICLHTDTDVADDLQRWRQRCRDDDADPAAWTARRLARARQEKTISTDELR